MRWLFVVLAAAALFAASASADLYSWTDRNGVRHVSVYPPPGGEAAGDLRVMKTSPAAEDTTEAKESRAGGEAGAQAVEIYVDGKSQDCMTALAFFTANGIPVQKYEIEKSPDAKKRFEAQGGGALPLILIGDQRMDGWDEPAARKLLGL
jgi:hypothetical protein